MQKSTREGTRARKRKERTYRGEGREDSGRETGTRLLDFLLPTVRCWEITNGEIGKRRGRSKGRGKREARKRRRSEGGRVHTGLDWYLTTIKFN